MKNTVIYTKYYECPEFGTTFTDFTTSIKEDARRTTLETGNGRWEVILVPGKPFFSTALLDDAIRHICTK